MNHCALLTSAAPHLDLLKLAMGFFGGLALFLFGMDMMSRALRYVAGDRMQAMLARLTRSRVSGVLTGTAVTSVLQSSSVTTVLVVGFVSAGLMSLAQAIPVVFGANIGTTITAQLVALDVTEYALLLVAAGYPLVLLGRRPRTRQYGQVISGVGLLFYGMEVMSAGMSPLRADPAFAEWMVRLQNPLLGVLVGAVFTALVQSSLATTGIVIALATQGLIGLPAAIAVMLGANIGTCVTALLSSIGKPREAGRVALAHVLFNVVGAAIWIGFVDQLGDIVRTFSTETPRQIANAHTVFNVTNTLLFLPFTGPLARLIRRVLPDRPEAIHSVRKPLFLDPELFRTPSLALAAVRREAGHVGEAVVSMVSSSLSVVLAGEREDLDELRARDKVVDGLHRELLAYLRRLAQTEMTPAQTRVEQALLEAVNGLEHIADIVETDLAIEGVRRIDKSVHVSPGTAERMSALHEIVTRAVRLAVEAVRDVDLEKAREVVAMKGRVNEVAVEAARRQRDRLRAEEPHRVETYRVETDLVEGLKRIYYYAKRLSRAQFRESPEEGPSQAA